MTTPLLSLHGGAWLGSDLKEATSMKNITSLPTIFLVGLQIKWAQLSQNPSGLWGLWT